MGGRVWLNVFLDRPRLNRRSARVRRTPRRAFDDDDLGPGNDGAMPPPDPGGAVRGKRARRPGRSRAAGGHSEQRSAPGCGFASSSSNEPIAHGGPSASAVRGGDPRVPGQSQPGFGARGGGEHCRFHRGDQGAAEGTDVAGRHQLVVPRHGAREPLSPPFSPPLPPVDRTSDPPRAFPARARNVTMNQDNRYFRLALQPGGVVRRREGRRWSDNEQISDSAANERAPERVPFITRARRFRTRAPRVETPQLTRTHPQRNYRR